MDPPPGPGAVFPALSQSLVLFPSPGHGVGWGWGGGRTPIACVFPALPHLRPLEGAGSRLAAARLLAASFLPSLPWPLEGAGGRTPIGCVLPAFRRKGVLAGSGPQADWLLREAAGRSPRGRSRLLRFRRLALRAFIRFVSRLCRDNSQISSLTVVPRQLEELTI